MPIGSAARIGGLIYAKQAGECILQAERIERSGAWYMPVLQGHEFDEKLAEIVARLRAALSPVAIYLYGSYAYGTPGPGSDIDLLVVVDESALDPYQRDALAYRALSGIGVPKDVQVYTRREFDERAALPVSFERTVRKKGRIVHGA